MRSMPGIVLHPTALIFGLANVMRLDCTAARSSRAKLVASWPLVIEAVVKPLFPVRQETPSRPRHQNMITLSRGVFAAINRSAEPEGHWGPSLSLALCDQPERKSQRLSVASGWAGVQVAYSLPAMA